MEINAFLIQLWMIKHFKGSILIAVAILSFTWIILYHFLQMGIIRHDHIALSVPKDTKEGGRFSVFALDNKTAAKNKIQFSLDQDEELNQKKLAVIRYEALKLKYTGDTGTVIHIRFAPEMKYGWLIRLVRICQEDRHWYYSVYRRGFLLFGEAAPVIAPVPRDSIQLICL